MANEPVISVCGNATNDAEIRFLATGAAVASFSLACTPRMKKGDQWEDGETVFYRVTAWRQMAENVGESVRKGMRVVVTGRLKVRTYEKDGERRTSVEIDAEHCGPDLRYATATVAKIQRSSGDTTGGSQDPWADVPPPDAEPPF